MHYIRFLKPPRLGRSGSGPATLNAKITITTDLGEAFLAADVALVVQLEVDEGNGKGRSVTVVGKEYVWRGREGMRALEVEARVPLSGGRKSGRALTMLVRPKEDSVSINTFSEVLGTCSEDGEGGGVVPVRSMDVYTSSTGTSMAERILTHGSGNSKVDVCIWEETGESIARHIWYAPTRREPACWTGTSSISFH
jgi:hypothetical protein